MSLAAVGLGLAAVIILLVIFAMVAAFVMEKAPHTDDELYDSEAGRSGRAAAIESAEDTGDRVPHGGRADAATTAAAAVGTGMALQALHDDGDDGDGEGSEAGEGGNGGEGGESSTL